MTGFVWFIAGLLTAGAGAVFVFWAAEQTARRREEMHAANRRIQQFRRGQSL